MPKYPGRERRAPDQWWRLLSAHISRIREELVTDACAHIQHCALRAHDSTTDTDSDNQARPDLTAVLACDIKSDISFRDAISGPYGGYYSDAAHAEFAVYSISAPGSYVKSPPDAKQLVTNGCLKSRPRRTAPLIASKPD